MRPINQKPNDPIFELLDEGWEEIPGSLKQSLDNIPVLAQDKANLVHDQLLLGFNMVLVLWFLLSIYLYKAFIIQATGKFTSIVLELSAASSSYVSQPLVLVATLGIMVLGLLRQSFDNQ